MSRIYEDIASRTGGDIYIGVVGPVRTGKSTLIKRFMETMVIPYIDNVYKKERARDELPQSGSGKTIMTVEPKFVPEEAAQLRLDEHLSLQIRLIDCVGYLIDGALGQMEDDTPRMVTTPWFDHPLSMKEAAELGTRKVIHEHSTIGLLVTTDGSISDFPREAYVPAEERVVEELKSLGKPFIVVINSKEPGGEAAQALKAELTEKYQVGCECVNCQTLDEQGVEALLKAVLYEFPVREIRFTLPKWTRALLSKQETHPVFAELCQVLLAQSQDIEKLWQITQLTQRLSQSETIENVSLAQVETGQGQAHIRLDLPRSLYYELLTEACGRSIGDEGDLIPVLRELSRVGRAYDRISAALEQVDAVGYGIVMPDISELKLEEPEIVRQGGRFGVRLRASAPSIHMIKADIHTEVSPAVGSERQSEELLSYLLSEFDGETDRIWQSNIFGKSLHELVNEGLNAKLAHMPDAARAKLQDTLERVINEGCNGLFCIIV
ncbi:MAG: stage IV sporulation protein A [Ruminococcaceae bacterium]|nr:stage IV sporulation protein A [Oscillospiraceae bacterium]